MGIQKYSVLIGNNIIATEMDLTNATILLRGLFDTYYNDPMLSITIKKVPEENLGEVYGEDD